MPPSLSEYRYNVRAGRYTRRGRFVSGDEIELAIAGAIRGLNRRVLSLASDLRLGRISVADWRAEMRAAVKDAHLYQAALARGGWARLTVSDMTPVASDVRFHLGRLERFAHQIARGEVRVGEPGFLNRVGMYMKASRSTYYVLRRGEEERLGNRWERNVLGAAEHCGDCLAASARGWVPVGTNSLPGTRECMSNCECSLVFASERPDARVSF